MFRLIRFTIAFSLTFIILSIPWNKKTLFYHLSSVTAPMTNMVFNSITDNAKNTINKTKDISKDLFTKSKTTHTDRVQKTNSAIRKENKYYKPYAEQVREEISHEDREQLNKIIK